MDGEKNVCDAQGTQETDKSMQSTPPNGIHCKLFSNFVKYFQAIYGDGKITTLVY